MTIQEEYKYFIENCTSTPKSYKNYSDFSRICKTVAAIKKRTDFDIYSITDVETLENLIEVLENNVDFQDYNKKGGNQYMNALLFYLRFLKAREFFKIPHAKKVQKECKQQPLQQIYYGAPGTGKSYEIDKITKEYDTIRTTFHPDSDYSTFVGAYKPTMTKVELRDVSGHVVKEGNDIVKEDRITYKFVKQAFLKAYLAAWKKYAECKDSDGVQPQFLVIEEINRGNCAQIFGDLFQLLDRQDNGFSSYPIEADADLQREIAEAFAEKDGEYQLPEGGLELGNIVEKYHGDLAEDIKSGRILLLPSNLYIWATMNTSDQSLFPIDSAFKRRWDWHYVPISDAGKQWVIRVNGNDYGWWDFLEEINKHIYEATYSEDKKLGYFFCKAKDGVIDAEMFVGKVVFYLWNDVFKDTEFEGDAFKDGDNSKLSFDKFYMVEDNKTKAVSDKVELFLKNLGLESIEIPTADDNTKADSKIEVNGTIIDKVNAIPYSTIEEYVKLNPKKSAQEVADIWRGFKKCSMRKWIIATKDELETMPEKCAKYSHQIKCADDESVWVNKDGWMYHPKSTALRDTIKEFIDAVNISGLGIKIKDSNE